MSRRPDYPEFDNIRSHIQRADAQRSVATGVIIAETLLLAGDMLRRAAAVLLAPARAAMKRRPARLEG
jgi:hypothetical protein